MMPWDLLEGTPWASARFFPLDSQTPDWGYEIKSMDTQQKTQTGFQPDPRTINILPPGSEISQTARRDNLVFIAKELRKSMDEMLDIMRIHRDFLQATPAEGVMENKGEAIANHILSIRDLESAMMRQGLVLNAIGTPNPYPESKNPDSPVVHPFAP